MPEPTAAPAPVVAFIALGANLGEAGAMLRWAMAQIDTWPGVQVQARSSLYRSAPVDSNGPDYINAVIRISTTQTAYHLLTMLLNLEQIAGRERPYLHAPRTLDLDLLLYGNASIHSERLTVPHPRMYQRAFVLQPLHEIAPELVSPSQLQSVCDQAIERLHQP